MKFFHLSDLHIGLKLINRDLMESQEYILDKIVKAVEEERPDAVVIAGDIYDKSVPSAEAVELFNRFCGRLKMAAGDAPIMMISGNHDSGARIDLFRDVLTCQNLYMVGQPPRKSEEYIQKVKVKDEYGDVTFYLLPFVKPSMIKEITGTDEKGNNLSYNEAVHKLIQREHVDVSVRNVLVSHQFYLPSGKSADDIERMDSEIRTVGNIDEINGDVLECFDYAALGHIHKPMKVGSEFYRYCGTPLACSVSEAGQEKGIIVVEMKEKGCVKTRVLPLEPLHQVRIIKGEMKEVLAQACEDYVTVILTDKLDLDIMDMQDRIRNAFPNLLEIRRETLRETDPSRKKHLDKVMDPFELCCSFLKDMDEEEKDILRDVIATVQGVK